MMRLAFQETKSAPQLLTRVLILILALSAGPFPVSASCQVGIDASGHNDHLSEGTQRFLLAHSEPASVRDGCTGTCFRLIRFGYPSARIVTLRLMVDQNGDATVFTKIFSGDRQLVLQKMDAVPRSDLTNFMETVKQSNFWQLPGTEPQEGPLVKDGSVWTIEGAEGASYHIVRRRNPKPSRFTDIARCLRDFAQLSDSVVFMPVSPAPR